MLGKINSKLSYNLRKVVPQSYFVEDEDESFLKTTWIGPISSLIEAIELSPTSTIRANLKENEFDPKTVTRKVADGVVEIDEDLTRFCSNFVEKNLCQTHFLRSIT